MTFKVGDLVALSDPAPNVQLPSLKPEESLSSTGTAKLGIITSESRDAFRVSGIRKASSPIFLLANPPVATSILKTRLLLQATVLARLGPSYSKWPARFRALVVETPKPAPIVMGKRKGGSNRTEQLPKDARPRTTGAAADRTIRRQRTQVLQKLSVGARYGRSCVFSLAGILPTVSMLSGWLATRYSNLEGYAGNSALMLTGIAPEIVRVTNLVAFLSTGGMLVVAQGSADLGSGSPYVSHGSLVKRLLVQKMPEELFESIAAVRLYPEPSEEVAKYIKATILLQLGPRVGEQHEEFRTTLGRFGNLAILHRSMLAAFLEFLNTKGPLETAKTALQGPGSPPHNHKLWPLYVAPKLPRPDQRSKRLMFSLTAPDAFVLEKGTHRAFGLDLPLCAESATSARPLAEKLQVRLLGENNEYKLYHG